MLDQNALESYALIRNAHQTLKVRGIKALECLIDEFPSILTQRTRGGLSFADEMIGEDRLDVLTFLLDRGYPINSASPKGFTLLHWAAHTGRFDFVKMLVEKGAEVDIRTGAGFTPLMVAISHPDDNILEIVRYLVEHGANPNAMDVGGLSVLRWTLSRKWHAMRPVISFLLPLTEESILLVDKYGQNCVQLAEKQDYLDLFPEKYQKT